MKKKIIGVFTVLCLIFPCFFAVACKDKSEPNFDPYTYSVTLKGAYGKVDEATLTAEYDHEKGEHVSWTKENSDYKISVTRSSHLAGNIIINLLECSCNHNFTANIASLIVQPVLFIRFIIKHAKKIQYITLIIK